MSGAGVHRSGTPRGATARAAGATVVLAGVLRAVPHVRVLGGLAAAAAAVATGALLGGHRGAVLALQASTVLVAGVALALIDEPRDALQALPTSLPRRRALVLAVGLPLLAAAWAALLHGGGSSGAEAAALSVQCAAVVALSLGIGALTGAPTLGIAGVALAFGTGRIAFGDQLFPAGTEAARWAGAAGWWLAAAGAGTALLIAGSRDPA